MAELLKNIYNETFFKQFTGHIKELIPSFNKTSFIEAVFDNGWAEMELKQRMRHISLTLHDHLSKEFKKDAGDIVRISEGLIKKGVFELGLEYMFLPDYIEVFGLEEYDISMKAFEEITQFSSCEFAVRPFLIKYPKKGMKQMAAWSKHKHLQVRRLSSEGARPRLPWAMALPDLKQDPTPLLPILNRLKNDEAETVRRSVANNLNDISKDNPSLVIELAQKWYGKNANTDWLVKHACRTLLKQGEPQLMPLFGYGSIENIEIADFKIVTPKVKLGESLIFNFSIKNKHENNALLRLEYAIYYQKANGTLSKKVYKISEKEYGANITSNIERKQPFKKITTRVLHPGLHQVALIVNGQEFEKHDFQFVN